MVDRYNKTKTIIYSIFAYISGFLAIMAIITLICYVLSYIDIVLAPIYMALSLIVVYFFVILVVSCIYGIIKRKHAYEFIKRLATFPGRHNYNWQGGYSFFTCIILYTVTILRSVSILQLSKQIYRSLGYTGRDIKSRRPNVSPLFQEIYFLIWVAILLFQLFCGYQNEWLYGLDIYFIIESLTWILYYSFFRRFYEENYSIYHVLEHLPIILLLIPLQAIAYALVTGDERVTWKNIFTVLLGQASENAILFSFFGFLYSAIVISMIISMFPTENIKKGNPDTVIIGAGDVVLHRLLPAYIKRELSLPENRRGKINVFDIESGDKMEKILDKKDITLLDSIAEKANSKKDWEIIRNQRVQSVFTLIEKKRTSDDRIAWICTPSDTHWYYLELLQSKADFIAVEKPITNLKSDLDRYRDYIQNDNRNRTFFLSYYLLDKALPLTFIARPRNLYLKYLIGFDYKGDKIVDKNKRKHNKLESIEIIELFYQKCIRSIGKGIESFDMVILEGEDRRNLPFGGQLIETFIHNCIIASLFTDLPIEWKDVKFNNRDNTSILMEAKGKNDCSITLVMEKKAKHNDRSKQSAIIYFRDGACLEADFKLKTAVYKYNTELIKIGVSPMYSGKYDVQCDMVYECYANGLSTSDVDGLYNQIEILEWLFEIQ